MLEFTILFLHIFILLLLIKKIIQILGLTASHSTLVVEGVSQVKLHVPIKNNDLDMNNK
jgi:hypothetical protein